jgi:hypothetical protein
MADIGDLFSVALSLLNGMPAQVQGALAPKTHSTLTNVDDVTQDQPNPRALRAIAVSAFPCAAFHLATTTPPVSSGRFAAARRIDA